MLHCPYIAYCNRNILLAAGEEQQTQNAKCLKVKNSNIYSCCTGAVIGGFKIQDQKHTGDTVVQNPANDLLVYSLYIISIEDFITFHYLLDHRQGIFYCVFHGKNPKTKLTQNSQRNEQRNKQRNKQTKTWRVKLLKYGSMNYSEKLFFFLFHVKWNLRKV